jgi:hypothetical protein
MVNEHAIKGEKNTGFEKAGTLGEFECGNCKYYHSVLRPGYGGCSQTDMLIYSRERSIEVSGKRMILVGFEDCCEYVDRRGNQSQSLTDVA